MLSKKQKAAADHWLGGLSRSAALRKAGYSENTALHHATAVLDTPSVAEYIEERRDQLGKKLQLNQEWVLSRLMAIVDAAPSDIMSIDRNGEYRVDVTKLTPELRKALLAGNYKMTGSAGPSGGSPGHSTSLKIMSAELSTGDKLRALDQIAKIQGYVEEKITVEGNSLAARIIAGRKRIKSSE